MRGVAFLTAILVLFQAAGPPRAFRCQCPQCVCATTPDNKACECSPKCHCDEQAHAVGAAVVLASTVTPAPAKRMPVPADKPKPEPLGDYESFRIRLRLVTTRWCGPCRMIGQTTIPQLLDAGWSTGFDEKKHIQLADGDKVGGTVPRWERIVDGKIVETRFGYMTPAQVDSFLTGGVPPKRRVK